MGIGAGIGGMTTAARGAAANRLRSIAGLGDAAERGRDAAWNAGTIRARSLDAVLMRDNWLAAYDFATARGALFLGEYARAADPFAEVGRKTVSVQVTSIVRASDDSFRVNWTEQAFERGSLSATSRWTAVLTIKIRPPRSADALRKNPLGLYIDAIDWSRELETPALPRIEAAPPAEPPSAGSLPRSIPQGSPLGETPEAALTHTEGTTI